MAKTMKYERKTIHCAEEKCQATLMLEWREEGGKRVLVGVECDNPKLRGLAPYVCKWSCWHKLEPSAGKKTGVGRGKKTPVKKGAKKPSRSAPGRK